MKGLKLGEKFFFSVKSIPVLNLGFMSNIRLGDPSCEPYFSASLAVIFSLVNLISPESLLMGLKLKVSFIADSFNSSNLVELCTARLLT